MRDITTKRPQPYKTPVQRYAWAYLTDHKGRAENTVRNDYEVVQRLFRFVKRECWDIPEEEFMVWMHPSTDEPRFPAEIVCSMNKREIGELLKEHPYDAINAEACVEYEQEHKNRENILRRFRMKQRADPKLDYVDITDKDIRRLTDEDVYEYIKHIVDINKVSTAKGYLRKIKLFTKWASIDNGGRSRVQVYGGIRDSDLNYLLIEDMLDSRKDGVTESAKTLGHQQAVQLLERNRNPKHRALLMLGLKCGLRREEYARIKMKHVHLDEKYIEIKDRKNYHDSRVLIDKECVRYLKTYIMSKRHTEPDDYLFTHGRNNPYTTTSIGNMIRRLMTNAELDLKTLDNGEKMSRFSSHSLRHTFSNHYTKTVGDTQAGDRECMKIQKAHKLSTSENYSAAKHQAELSMEQRREDYDKAVPKYLDRKSKSNTT